MHRVADGNHLAAIDIGSNSFRLEIGAFRRGHYRRIDYVKDVVRLGGGLDASGLLTEAAMQHGLDSLRRFAERLAPVDARHVRAVATQTLREARNRNAFLERASRALGHPIEIISGREEARLIYAGVGLLQPTTGARLVVDIGGRSTEMILGTGHRTQAAESFQVGSVGLSLEHFGDGRLSARAFRAAQVAAGAELEEALTLFAPERWTEALGSSGTVHAVADLLAASGVTDGTITPKGLAWCIERCIDAGHVDALRLPALKADRRAVLPGGLAILYTLLTQFGIAALAPTPGALRHGVLAELRDRLLPPRAARARDPRHASVRELQRRFGVDLAQAGRVGAVARALHAQCAPDADDESRRELEWACALHEVGMYVSHHDYHRHSAYLVGHLDAAGMSQSQQRLLAELVLGQRGGLRKIGSLERGGHALALQLLCLRLAVVACHARGAVETHAITLEPGADAVRVRYGAQWARRHPRTVHLLRQEAGAWERHGALRLHLPADG